MTRALLVKADETAELDQHYNVIFCDVLVYAERKYGTIMCDQFFLKTVIGWDGLETLANSVLARRRKMYEGASDINI